MQEYRLVPVEEWTEVGEKRTSEHKVDVRALADTVWDSRKFILKVTAVFVIVGLLIALLSPVGYKVEATLLPESQTASAMAGGLLEQFGGILGLSGASLKLAGGGNISPQLYPKIVSSLPYQLELLNQEVTFSRYDTMVTVYSFFDDIYTPSILTYIKGYTLGLPGKIKGLFSEDQPAELLPANVPSDSIISLTKHQLAIVNVMRKHITVRVNEENGLVNLSVSMPGPQAAAQIGQASIKLLKEYVTNYRTRKAEQYLDFVREQTQQAKAEFQNIQNRLAQFRDSNINLMTATARTQLQRLESKYNLRFDKYNSLAQQLQQARLKVQQKTPVVSVLKPVKVPVDNYKPQKKMITIIALILGLVLSVGFVVGRTVIEQRKESSDNN